MDIENQETFKFPSKTHGGEDIPGKMDFFAEPPAGIGKVLSGYSTLRKDEQPISMSSRVKTTLILLAIGLVIAFAINYFADVSSNSVWYFLWYLVFGFIGVFLGVTFTLFEHDCSFVGEKGTAKFFLSGNRDAEIKKEIFLFNQADDLYTTHKKVYTNFTYKNTSYTFEWKSSRQESVYTISGSYVNKDGPPKNLNDSYYFATAAEISWSKYKLAQMIKDLDNQKTVCFKFDNNTIEIGKDFFSLSIGNEKDQWQLHDIDCCGISGAKIIIYGHTFDKGGILYNFTGKDSLEIPYSKMPNAQLFLFLMEHLLGK